MWVSTTRIYFPFLYKCLKNQLQPHRKTLFFLLSFPGTDDWRNKRPLLKGKAVESLDILQSIDCNYQPHVKKPIYLGFFCTVREVLLSAHHVCKAAWCLYAVWLSAPMSWRQIAVFSLFLEIKSINGSYESSKFEFTKHFNLQRWTRRVSKDCMQDAVMVFRGRLIGCISHLVGHLQLCRKCIRPVVCGLCLGLNPASRSSSCQPER